MRTGTPGSARGPVVWKGQSVTDLLKNAFDAASQLPEEEQEVVAEWLFAELASEEKWAARLAESQDALSLLAREALDEHARGQTKEVL